MKLFELTPETQMHILRALEGIVEIGKRDLSNPKYDEYFTDACQALREAKDEILPQLFNS
jgi:hypothetical protein